MFDYTEALESAREWERILAVVLDSIHHPVIQEFLRKQFDTYQKELAQYEGRPAGDDHDPDDDGENDPPQPPDPQEILRDVIRDCAAALSIQEDCDWPSIDEIVSAIESTGTNTATVTYVVDYINKHKSRNRMRECTSKALFERIYWHAGSLIYTD